MLESTIVGTWDTIISGFSPSRAVSWSPSCGCGIVNDGSSESVDGVARESVDEESAGTLGLVDNGLGEGDRESR